MDGLALLWLVVERSDADQVREEVGRHLFFEWGLQTDRQAAGAAAAADLFSYMCTQFSFRVIGWKCLL